MLNRNSAVVFIFILELAAPTVGFASGGLRRDRTCEILLHEGLDYGVMTFPREVSLDLSKSQLKILFNASEELGSREFAIDRLSEILEKVAAGQPLNEAEALELKQSRSLLKKLRFAVRTFDEKHRYPLRLHAVTRLLGQVKDGLINGQTELVAERSAELLPWLKRKKWGEVASEVEDIKLCRRKSLIQFLRDEINTVKDNLTKSSLTPHEFHEMRKVVSGLLRFFEVTVQNTETRDANLGMVEYLSTLNSRMGDLHNEMIARMYRGELDYNHSSTILPSDVARSLKDFVEGFDSILSEP